METQKHLERIRARREADLTRLSDPARQFYERELRAGTGAERVRKALWRIDYEREPVSVRQFIYDDEFLGKTMKGNIFPRIVDDLEELFAGNYTEVVLGGAIGWGKTRFMEVAVAYDLYLLTCLKDPAAAYGMMPGSNMTFVNVSVNVTQATRVFFQDLYNLIKASPYFRSVFPYDRKLKNEILFAEKNVRCYPVAASEQAALGMGVFCACIDEANYMEVVERSKRKVPGESGLFDRAQVVFNKLKQRMRSRTNQRGRLPGHIYVASSARYPGDMTERMEKLAREEAEKGEYNIFVRHYALWDTRPAGTYLKGTFKVEVGDLTRRSRVLDGTETDVKGRVIDVPMDFKREFDRDADACVRDYAGISTLSIKPFLVKREMIRNMFDMGNKAGLRHPFTQLEVTLQHKDPAYERLVPENLHWTRRQKANQLGRPMFDGEGPVMERVLYASLYHAHIDLSKTGDATGLAVAHVVATKKCYRFDEETMADIEEVKPVIRVDWVQRILPPPNGEIDIPRVRALVYQLSKLGMKFGSITCDTFGSQESVKTLKEKGYPADTFSVDADKDAYSALKDAIYDGRVLCYEHPVLERELAQLEDTGKKIDHPSFPGASKDLADCLAAVVHHCEEGWRKGEGSRGLFQVGDVERPGEVPDAVQEHMTAMQRKVARGEALTPQDEDHLLFDQFLQDLLTKDDEERFGGTGGNDETV